MNSLFQFSLIIHIAAGFIAFVAAPVAMLMKKGRQGHRLSGKAFVWSMHLLLPTAFIMAILHSNPFLFMIAGFSYYLVISGHRWIAMKKCRSITDIAFADWMLVVLASIFNISLCIYGLIAAFKSESSVFGYIAIGFGLIGLSLVYINLKQFVRADRSKYAWLLNHMGGMVGGYIATVSAFSVNNFHFMPTILRWLWPTIIGVPLLVAWIARYKKTITHIVSIFMIMIISSGAIAKTIKGQITDEHHNPLPYVSIGVAGTPYGTVSNESGSFAFEAEDISDTDSIRFSLVGFKTKTISITWPTNLIVLEQDVHRLSETVITGSLIKKRKIGCRHTNTNLKVNFAIHGLLNNNLGSEIGRRFHFNRNSLLTKLSFFLATNDYDTSTFKINIYNLSAGGKPGEMANTTPIICNLYKQTGWADVDLKNYRIIVGKDIVVSVEWVGGSINGSTLSLPITFPSALATHYYKMGSQNKWKIFHNMSSAISLEVQQ